MMEPVPTLFVGRTQSGKTYRAAREAEGKRDGIVLFFEPKFQRTVPGIVVDSCADMIQALQANVRQIHVEVDYDAFDEYFEYVWNSLLFARKSNLPSPRIYWFIDEVDLVAPRGTMGTSAEHVFTKCFGLGVVGIALTNRMTMTARNIVGQAYQLYIFDLEDGDVMDLWEQRRLTLPYRPPSFSYSYARYYNGRWYRGDRNGVEVELASAPTGSARAPVV